MMRCQYSKILPINKLMSFQFSSVQSLSHVRLFVTPRIAARQASLSIINSRSSLKLMSIESVMPSSHLILCRPLLLLPPIPPSIRVFSFFYFYFYFILLYNTVLVLPYIDMNPPRSEVSQKESIPMNQLFS